MISYRIYYKFGGHLEPDILFVMRGFAYGMILWGVLSPVGYRIRTYSGETLPEVADEEWHKFCYAIAAYALIFSYMLEHWLVHSQNNL